METHSFRIKGMCCGQEVGLLRSEVAPLVGGDQKLSFDLLQSRMTISGSMDASVAESVMAAVARTGMEAVPSEDTCAAGVCATQGESAWEKHGRLFACLASGLLLTAAFVFQALNRGSIFAALAGQSGTGAPIFAIVLYISAILAGGWFLFPKALYAARKLKPDMNLLMTVAVLGAISLGEWLEAASVIFLFALALLLESWSLGKAKREITALLDITPPKARFICPHDGDIEEKPVGEIPVGATVVVRAGERIGSAETDDAPRYATSIN
jgi:Cd2+/Zn2+-exporting ATPase